MSTDTIEREIVIAAPVERVWEIVTEPEHMGRWFGDAGAERDGDTITMRWEEHGEAELRDRPLGARRTCSPTAGTRTCPGSATRSSSSRSHPRATAPALRVVESGFASLAHQRRRAGAPARGQRRRLGARARRPRALRRVRGGVTEDVFTALADPTRRTILDLLATHGHGTATTLAAALPVSRPAVIKHLAVLDRAGLVAAQRHGREVRYVVQPAPLQETAAWMARLAAEWDARLAAVKALAEEASGRR